MNTILVPLSIGQQFALEPLFASLVFRGSIMAQVYPDGMRVRLLTPEMTAAVSKVFGLPDDSPTARYAIEAHEQREAA